MDPFQAEIATYDWRYYDPHPSPRHVIDAQNDQQYYFYYTPFIQPRVGMYFRDGNAPDYGSTRFIYDTRQSGLYQLGAQAAKTPTQAPTKGAYTGIDSGCGPNGLPLGANTYG